jgi:hypothetical protein
MNTNAEYPLLLGDSSEVIFDYEVRSFHTET